MALFDNALGRLISLLSLANPFHPHLRNSCETSRYGGLAEGLIMDGDRSVPVTTGANVVIQLVGYEFVVLRMKQVIDSP